MLSYSNNNLETEEKIPEILEIPKISGFVGIGIQKRKIKRRTQF